jgi:hypothetical protein
MPLHLTKIAYGAQSLEELHGWFKDRGDEAMLTTRYLPKRHEELAGGSLYWIFKNQLVARSAILRFEEAEGGKTHIVISCDLIPVHPRTKRAHQGWRYLADEDAPLDLDGDVEAGEMMPGRLAGELARLGLV